MESVQEDKTGELLQLLRSFGTAVIGYSGGVDSAVLCAAAWRALGRERMLACLADGPSLPASEKRDALATAEQAGFPVRVYGATEMENPDYVRNASDRCYHCKSDLFLHLRRIAAETGFAHCLYGANADDRDDFRPGHRAAHESGALAPLAMLGFTKVEIRALALSWGLSAHDKPASPCLSSRIPYGEKVTRERLTLIEAGEDLMRRLGFREFRVRWNDGGARVEAKISELYRLFDLGCAEEITRGLLALGFAHVILDPEGFRSGRLNEALSSGDKNAMLLLPL